MAAAPFAAGYNMVLVEPAMGFHHGCPRLMLAPVGVRLPAGFHLVSPLTVATRTSTGGARAVAAAATGYFVAVPPAADSLTAATGGLTYLGGRSAPGFGAGAEERASRGPRFVGAAAGYGHGAVALEAVPYSSTGQAGAGGRPGAFTSTGVLAGTAGSGRFRSMSVVAKAGDEPRDPVDEDIGKAEEYIRKRKGPIDAVLREIAEFNPHIGTPESFAICRDKDMLLMFERKIQLCYGTILRTTLELYAPTARNHEALTMIGKDMKMVSLECAKGFLQAETLDRAVASLRRLRSTSLGFAEHDLKPLDTTISTPRLPVKDDDSFEINNYFVYMRCHLEELMKEVILFMVRTSTIPGTFQEMIDDE